MALTGPPILLFAFLTVGCVPEMDKKVSIVAEVERLGGEVTYDEKHPDRPVVAIRLTGTKVTDAWLDHLKSLITLRSLILNGTNVTDAGLDAFKD